MTIGIDYLDEIEEKKKKLDEKYKKRRDKELTDLAAVLKTAEGRRLVWRILTEAGIFRSTFSGDEQGRQSWLEGKKDVGYLLMSDIMATDIKMFVQMQQEQIAKQKQDEAEEKEKGGQ